MATGAVAQDRIAIDVQRFTPDLPTFEFGPAHTGPDPFHDQVTFQLGDGADDDDHGPPQRAAGVDVLPEGNILDAQVVQFIEYFQEVANGAGQGFI